MNDHVTGGLKARIRKPKSAPKKKPIVERALYRGEVAVASGDSNYFARLAELSRGRIVVRSAEQNSYAELIEFVDRIKFDDPARAVFLLFPPHKLHDYRRAAALAVSTWHAETAIRAVVARDDHSEELVVTIHGERIVVRERSD